MNDMVDDAFDESAGTSSPATPDELDQENARLQKRLRAFEEDIAELKAKQDQLLRTAASYDNSRRRAERDLEDSRKYAVESFAKRMLPVADSLRRAVDAARSAADASGLVEGVDMVLKQLDDALQSEGVTIIEAVGSTFDPNYHEAVAQHATSEVPENTVVAELQKGYLLHDRLLRASSVLVAVAPSE
ncbi:nucleotide exchange factor GrpE [Candidatus Poribacteria bacterium]|nr:nucleotide exchange factor GrpE [Candidatus Poribacteria bacterium]